MRIRPDLTLVLLAFLSIVSCSSDPDPSLEDLSNVPFTRAVSMDTSLVMIATATDFCDLRSALKSTHVIREKHGIVNQEFYQGLLDTNLVVSVNDVKNFVMARDYTKSDQLMAPLTQVSQEGNIQTILLDQQLEYTRETNDTLVMYMSFKTMKYEIWEQAFIDDYREDPSKDFEVIRVFRGVDEPNHVHMIFKVNDPNYVQTMEKNNAFRMKMLAAGVVSYPVTYKLRPGSV
jgi:hypothetical protein